MSLDWPWAIHQKEGMFFSSFFEICWCHDRAIFEQEGIDMSLFHSMKFAVPEPRTCHTCCVAFITAKEGCRTVVAIGGYDPPRNFGKKQTEAKPRKAMHSVTACTTKNLFLIKNAPALHTV